MNKYCITFDLDWAPDFAIQEAAELLIKNNIKCTWFITHESEYIQELYRYTDLFEFGIHPNFFKGSSHGSSEKEVLEYICSIVPSHKLVRTHALYQSSRLFTMMTEDFGIETDSSLLLNLTPNIVPHKIHFRHNSKGLFRIPYFWEDDIHMSTPNPEWNINSEIYHMHGLKIFNFHPLYTFLNSESIQSYESLKLRKPIQTFSKDELIAIVNEDDKKGIGVFFKNLMEYIVKKKIETNTLTELKHQFEISDNRKYGAVK